MTATLTVVVLIAGPPTEQQGPTSQVTQRYYVGHSTAACETIDYTCPPGWKAFQDEHGCGCVPPDEPAR